MLQTLINSIASDEQRERQTAQKRYAQLLIEDHHGNAQELKKLMTTLGKTSQDVQADYSAALEWRRLNEVIANGANLSDAQTKANQAVAQHVEKIHRVQTELREAHAKLVAEESAINNRYMAAQHAVQTLKDLRARRLDLFGDQPVPTTA